MRLNQDSLARSLIHATSTLEVRIHIYPSISISRTTQKYSTLNLGENSQKHSPISVFPCEINAQVILVTSTCYIILGDECSKKQKKKKKEYEEIKRGKCLEPRNKRKRETRGKNGRVSDSRIRGTRYPPERKEKENIEHLILFKSFKRATKVCIPSKEHKQNQTFTIVITIITIHHSFTTHAHLDLTY